MFPFTLGGPQFLVFYAVFALVVLIAFYWFTSAESKGTRPRLTELTADPYVIAYLRGGTAEATRIAVVNLLDRGLLVLQGTVLQTAKESAASFVRKPLDLAILDACRSSRTPSSRAPRALHELSKVQSACAEYEARLQARGLLADAEAKSRRNVAFTMVLLLLGGVALARLVQAFMRGHFSFFFLLVLTAIALWIAFRVYGERMTAAGKQALSSLETLMSRVKLQVSKLKPGGATNEALLLAAVFGVYALPAAFAFVQQVYPRPRSDGGSGGCGSSCGSSCGGGCGGGGCGG